MTTISSFQQGDRVRVVVEPKGNWEHSAYQTDNQFVLEVRPNRGTDETRTMGRLGSGVKSMGDAMTKVCHATGQEKFESWSRSRRRRRACALISGMSLVAAGVLGGAPAASGVAPASDGGAVGTAVGLPTSYTPPPRADLSGMTWQAAFKRLNDKMFREYAFTEWKGIQWQPGEG